MVTSNAILGTAYVRIALPTPWRALGVACNAGYGNLGVVDVFATRWQPSGPGIMASSA